MPAAKRNSPADAVENRIIVLLAVLMIAIATTFRGGNRYIPLNVIEWISLLIVPLLVWQFLGSPSGDPERPKRSTQGWLLIFLASSPLWAGLLQLGLFSPSRQGAGIDLSQLAQAIGQPSASFGQSAQPTWAAFLAGAPIAVCFVLALVASKAQLKTVVMVWIGIAVIQSIIALLQTTAARSLYFGGDQIYGAVGTFGNRNHLANFIAMTLPWVFLELRPPINRHRANSRKPWIWIAVLFVLLAALLATQSRMGISSGLLVLLMAAWAIAPKKKMPKKTRVWIGLGTLTIVGLALVSGGWQWLSRFDSDYLEQSAQFRENLRHLTWNAAMAYWPLGSGLGSFSLVFPAFQSADISGFVNYAHNDYLQLLLELGWVFVLLLLLVVGLVVNRSRQLLAAARASSSGWAQPDFFAVASGLGFLAIVLHAWVDFPMRIPANAMLGAFLLGVFLRAPLHKREKTTIQQQGVAETHV